MKNRLAVALVTVGALTFASVAHGILVTNTTLDTTLFDSIGFENDTVGTAPSQSSPGNWTSGIPPFDEVVGPASPGPGAFDGDNYLSTLRTTSSGNPQAVFANQNNSGDNIHVEYMLYMPVAGHDASIILNGDTQFWRGLSRLTGGSYGYYTGATYNFTANAYPFDTWFKTEIDYTIGDATYQVTLDGVAMPAGTTLNGISSPGTGDFAATSVGHNGSDPDHYYLDSVPGAPPPVLTPGDVDGDDIVDILDYNIIRDGMGMTPALRIEGDLTGDNLVSLLDFREWKAEAPPAVLSQLAGIPEPTSLSLLGAALLVLVSRRHLWI